MPTLLSKNIATLTTVKDTNHQLDIRTIFAPTKTSNPTLEHPAGTSKVDNEEKYQQQHNTLAPLSSQLPVPNMSLWEAAEQANIRVIRHYLDRTATNKDRVLLVNSHDPMTGATPLHLAITHAPTTLGNSTQALAADEKDMTLRLELITLLLVNGADAAICNLYNVQAIHMVPLHIPTNTLPFIVALLNHDANVNARDGDGWTPLHYAARFCQPPTLMIQALFAHGANVNATDYTSHKSCLFGLIANGDYVDCFQWIIQTTKANVQLRGQFNFSPITTTPMDNNNNKIPGKIVDPSQQQQQQQQQFYANPTDITKQATLVFQAVKYGRLGILRYLIHTPKTLNKLRSCISLEEVEQAQHIICQHLVGKERNHWEHMDKEIRYLVCLLEHDPRSLMAKQSRRLAVMESASSSSSSSSINWATRGLHQRRKLARKIRKFFIKPKQLIQG